MKTVDRREDADVGRFGQWFVLESLREFEVWRGMAYMISSHPLFDSEMNPEIVLVWDEWHSLELVLRERLGEDADASYFWPLASDNRTIDLPTVQPFDPRQKRKEKTREQLNLL